MILRMDVLQTELPPPSDPDPAGAAAVQELLGGKFGEMSTWLNYTFQSFNFRSRQGALPFYDLLCSIAAEEFGHVELVCATINTMLTDPGAASDGRLSFSLERLRALIARTAVRPATIDTLPIAIQRPQLVVVSSPARIVWAIEKT